MRANTLYRQMLMLAPILVLGIATGCDSSDPDTGKADTLNSQPADTNPQVDRDPTPDSGTGGEQQGKEPSQPAGN